MFLTWCLLRKSGDYLCKIHRKNYFCAIKYESRECIFSLHYLTFYTLDQSRTKILALYCVQNMMCHGSSTSFRWRYFRNLEIIEALSSIALYYLASSSLISVTSKYSVFSTHIDQFKKFTKISSPDEKGLYKLKFNSFERVVHWWPQYWPRSQI